MTKHFKGSPLKLWLAAAAWAGIIFYLSSRSTMPLQPPFRGFDKLVHAFEYGLLCLLLARAIHPVSIFRISTRAWTAAVLASFLYGISDEIHQAFVPCRSCETWDALFDLLGAAVTAFIASRFRDKR